MVISLIFDGIIINYLPYLVNDLSFFTPMFTLISIFIIYPLYRKKEKYYFIALFILGIVYDLMYTNMLFFNATIFIIIGLFTKIINKNLELSILKNIIYIIFIIIIYEFVTAIILYIYNIVPISIDKVLYKIIHSIILNVIYGDILFLFIKVLPKKYKEININ